jgi:hypothetical protein
MRAGSAMGVNNASSTASTRNAATR